MALIDEMRSSVNDIFRTNWKPRDGNVVPVPESLRLGDNEAVKLTGTVLYADIDGSTNMVDRFRPDFCAEVYKAYLSCAGKLIRSEQGVITAYDGDRAMAVFIGNGKEDRAVKSAMKLCKAVTELINPIIAEVRKSDFKLRHSVGIDTSPLFVVRTGVRGATDLVWVGKSANWAAKLSSISDYPHQIFITQSVYDGLTTTCRLASGKNMWTYMDWKGMKIIKTRYHGFM